MDEPIGQILGFAVGVAISPMPIIAVILMLFSKSAAGNSVSFLIGWLVGLTSVSIIVLTIGLEGSGGDSDARGIVKVVLLLVLGAKVLGELAKGEVRCRACDAKTSAILSPPVRARWNQLTRVVDPHDR